ncbi:acetyltransferase [Piscirickettsia salmonis]|uniref:Acetyltransferase (GNAT) family protein n=2 Tax=Piscirickettsia salmonis TaxID=1238 RepID=A0A9Q6PXP2_PISSA|nr:acetyltransferase [Piscirickettsia salmonis]APS43300.1 acetyltransferase [Piscirickettsia salmonis]APS46650.1 acetyltransferase [Piscirickettsia salmonis]APS50628.1 acetyltransferase [Piscirickettsia salmonis]APS53830.1 acetyltransferase [Piscirickettsia salmonis]
MKIRTMVTDDINTVFDIRGSVVENYLSTKELAELGFTPDLFKNMLLTDCVGWITYTDVADAGFVVVNTQGKILGLFVRPDFEGMGFGKALLKQAESWLYEQGIKEAWLATSNDFALRHLKCNTTLY